MALKRQNIPFKENKTDLTIEFYSEENGKLNVVQFAGLDDPEKIKSFKGCTMVWMEEATGFTRSDFTEIDLMLREATGHYHQIMMSFNPDESKAKWLLDDFFTDAIPKTGPGVMEDSYIHHSTVADNPIREVRLQYYKTLLRIKDPILRKIYLAGIWAAPKGRIFSWDLVPLPEMGFDQIWQGLDFGYSVDEAAVMKIYRRSHEYWLELLLYEIGLTDPAMAKVLKADPRFDSEAPTYCDNSEPKAIQTLRDHGINARPCLKGKGSVMTQLDQMNEFEIHVVENELAHNAMEEMRRYKYEQDKNGEIKRPIRPVDAFDHAITASRYGIFTNFDLYLRPSWKKGRVHKGPTRRKKEQEAIGDKAVITSKGRALPPEAVQKDSGEPKEKKTGGFSYGKRKGKVHIGRK